MIILLPTVNYIFYIYMYMIILLTTVNYSFCVLYAVILLTISEKDNITILENNLKDRAVK